MQLRAGLGGLGGRQVVGAAAYEDAGDVAGREGVEEVDLLEPDVPTEAPALFLGGGPVHVSIPVPTKNRAQLHAAGLVRELLAVDLSTATPLPATGSGLPTLSRHPGTPPAPPS